MSRTPRTGRLLKKANAEVRVRLTRHDRAFLADLAKVGVICEADASAHHYQNRTTPAKRRLNTLASAGILKIDEARDRDHRPIRVYTWSSESVAKAYGSRQLKHSATRSLYHELLVSRAYYSAGRPESYRVAVDLDKDELKQLPGWGNADTLPDAVFKNEAGDLVVVEADSGHYSSTQIAEKMSAWSGCRQLWVQPGRAHARVPTAEHVQVLTF